MVSTAILAIGSLGVLALYVMSRNINEDTRTAIEASMLAQARVEMFQTRSLNDPTSTGTGCGAVCWTTGWTTDAALKSTTVGTLGMDSLGTGANSAVEYQVAWTAGGIPSSVGLPANGVRHFQLRVYWPRARESRSIDDPNDSLFVNCAVTPQSCRRVEYNVYRKTS